MDLLTRLQQADPDDILIGIGGSLLRRVVGTGAIGLIGTSFLWHGYQQLIATGEGLPLILLAVAGFYGAQRFWRSSATGLVLTPTELRDTRGRQIVRVADIVAVNRDTFAMIKPTNGFVIAVRDKLPATISPGIWWRLGKRIGIGGLIGAGEGKAMAELLHRGED